MAQPPERASVSGYGGRISVRLAEDRGRLMRSLSARLRVTSGGRRGDQQGAADGTTVGARDETARQLLERVGEGGGDGGWRVVAMGERGRDHGDVIICTAVRRGVQ